MVLLNRLESYAERKGLFSDMQFGFKEGVGYIKSSFTILETINHMLERGSKVFGCFFRLEQLFILSGLMDGLMYRLFTEFGIKGRMWLVVKNLYNGVKV